MVSKSQADRAGQKLAKTADPDSTEMAGFSAAIDEWRASHGDALVWVAESVQSRLSHLAQHVAVGQRLKRKPQIIAKLRRERTRLAQMQDVGGCRAILETPNEVAAAAERIKQRTLPHYEVISESDYREHGRSDTGYRAWHLVLDRDGKKIEVQLRTLRQQAWAEAVERAANRSGFALKAGDGPTELIEFFRLASDAFHELDAGRALPAHRCEKLRDLRPLVDKYLPPVDTKGLRPSAKIRRQRFRTRLNNWLIVYDWRNARFIAWSDLGPDTAAAAETYASFEERYEYNDGYEVVLVGADSTDTIKRTHAHYFGKDPNDFDPLGFFAEVL